MKALIRLGTFFISTATANNKKKVVYQGIKELEYVKTRQMNGKLHKYMVK